MDIKAIVIKNYKIIAFFIIIPIIVFFIIGTLVVIYYLYPASIVTKTTDITIKTNNENDKIDNVSDKSFIDSSLLQNKVDNILNKYKSADIKIFFKDLNTGKTVLNIKGDQVILSASLIKLLILVESLSQKKVNPDRFSHEIKISPNNKALGTGIIHYINDYHLNNEVFNMNILNYLMITKSDNTATNTIIDLLGINSINKRSQVLGLKKTVLRNKLSLTENKNIKLSTSTCNITTPEDIATILEYIYARKNENSNFNEALTMLNHQVDKKSIPQGLPIIYNQRFVTIYNKTGTQSNNRYDAAIIEYNNNSYILVVTVSNYNPTQANSIISEISEIMFYDYIVDY